jgi:hypothetical protein
LEGCGRIRLPVLDKKNEYNFVGKRERKAGK